MYSRLLLSCMTLGFALVCTSCVPRTLKSEFPTTWRPEERSKSPRWVVAYASSHAPALTPLKQRRTKQGYEVVSIAAATPQRVRERVKELRLGERKNDCLLLVGTTATLPGAVGIHHRMKGRGSDARYAMRSDGSTPLFAVGRLPSGSPKQTRMLVAKILSFERSRQIAGKEHKQAVLLVGDPIGGSERM